MQHIPETYKVVESNQVDLEEAQCCPTSSQIGHQEDWPIIGKSIIFQYIYRENG